MPSVDELLRKKAEREGRRVHTPAPKPRLGVGTIEPPATAPSLVAGARVTIGDPPIAVREGDRLTLTLNVPPRSKKNHKVNIATQSVAARRFAHQVKAAVEPHKAALGLPLPARWYNCAARFTVDNDAADTVGLMQGLADALEGAGVLVNDRWIRRWDGTDQTTDPVHPGVVLVLSPID